MTLLLISSDTVDTQMAGPGIRYWEFARHLSQTHNVTLLIPNHTTLSHPRVRIVQRTRQTLAAAVRAADVIVTQGYVYNIAPLLLSAKPLVIDLYDPLPIELLEHHAHLSLNMAQFSQSYCVARTLLLLQRGDFFLYCHDRQRDYWTGMLTAVGRMNHRQYRQDPRVSNLFGHVPYGISETPPEHTRTVLRESTSHFSEHDTILLWGGGLWKWFDPCSVIRAIADISTTRQDIKLLFLGAKRPDDATGPNVAYATEDAIALSKQLNVYQRTVCFHHAWIPYHDRQNYLLEANIGISTHFDTLETRLSFRTRLLDYLWAGLPMITTTGDVLSDVIEQHRLGLVVPPGDIARLKDAILRLADDPALLDQCRANIQRIAPQFFWRNAIQPLENFCAQPYRTSHHTAFTTWFHLLRFYAQTGKTLITSRAYQKLLAKLRQAVRRSSRR
ncbi:glycosyltransferase [candidate division KSB3 bacterium]|uniref:Glycosyltransferase n=1 Tax=candidate division KSB3 bacterium TaxID=2044937 RepID=A0A9D5Q7E5_9BACT|nr:glycosyltransferase [candidate division KSB3 bacterium]MBD3326217.1 glycosyltransferase [candidate division KSB3 bacterium]